MPYSTANYHLQLNGRGPGKYINIYTDIRHSIRFCSENTKTKRVSAKIEIHAYNFSLNFLRTDNFRQVHFRKKKSIQERKKQTFNGKIIITLSVNFVMGAELRRKWSGCPGVGGLLPSTRPTPDRWSQKTKQTRQLLPQGLPPLRPVRPPSPTE